LRLRQAQPTLPLRPRRVPARGSAGVWLRQRSRRPPSANDASRWRPHRLHQIRLQRWRPSRPRSRRYKSSRSPWSSSLPNLPWPLSLPNLPSLRSNPGCISGISWVAGPPSAGALCLRNRNPLLVSLARVACAVRKNIRASPTYTAGERLARPSVRTARARISLASRYVSSWGAIQFQV
jgi:hypothetical protein